MHLHLPVRLLTYTNAVLLHSLAKLLPLHGSDNQGCTVQFHFLALLLTLTTEQLLNGLALHLYPRRISFLLVFVHKSCFWRLHFCIFLMQLHNLF